MATKKEEVLRMLGRRFGLMFVRVVIALVGSEDGSNKKTSKVLMFLESFSGAIQEGAKKARKAWDKAS